MMTYSPVELTRCQLCWLDFFFCQNDKINNSLERGKYGAENAYIRLDRMKVCKAIS